MQHFRTLDPAEQERLFFLAPEHFDAGSDPLLLAVGLVIGATMFLMLITDFGLDRVLFEVVSAFATVGLSTGITADLPPGAQLLVVVLMFIGRIGPLTLASGLALRERARLYQLPEERTIVG